MLLYVGRLNYVCVILDYNYDILLTPINIFLNIKLDNLNRTLDFITTYLMTSKLCMFVDDPYNMNAYYINYLIELDQGSYIASGGLPLLKK